MTLPSSPNKNLQNLERAGALKAEPTSRQEIAGFLSGAADALGDSKQPHLSVSGHFKLAYDAAHALALVALRAHDYRPAQGPGHRRIVFQSLQHTVHAPAELWRTLDKYHDKRNASEYGGIVNVSSAEANDLIDTTDKLHRLVMDWLKKNRPELL